MRLRTSRSILCAFVTTLLTSTGLHGQALTPYEAAVANLEFREIGPTIMSGRVSDLAVVESDPSTFYVGTATGGVWKTTNHGTTFEPVFENEATASVGDVTLAPSNANVVWVGTGEPQNRQSSPWGNGVYRSMDGGVSWTHKGLEDTHHISRIQVHPRNPDVAYVAAVGHLWASNSERGVYRTKDGGTTWDKVLYVDEQTGAIDLIMDPNDPNALFAAMYQRQRKAWGFNGGGPGSGIYRSLDGGESWTKLTKGLPSGDMGRIGLDIYRGDGNLVFAIVEANPRTPGGGFGGGGSGQSGVYKSTDRGETWTKVSDTNNRPMYYSQLRIDPNDPERLYTGGSNLFRSSDGGKTFTPDGASGVHLDHHALWIDPSNSEHLILGSDGGVSISWDRSDSWRQLFNLPISQFYEVGVDMRDPYHVCGGLQDNGSWCAPSDTRSNQGIRTRDWYNVSGGDGFFTVFHPTNPDLMFAESQGGNITRVNLNTMEGVRMRPVGRPGADGEDPELRWNWNSPIVVSAHDPNRVYLGGNMLFRSPDLGQSWEAISPDLTYAIDRETLAIMGVPGSAAQNSVNDGQSSYGNLTVVSESALNGQVLYTGSDDGRIQGSVDGGTTWTDLTPNVPGLPANTYVTRIVASNAREATVVAAFDGHRNDNFDAYLYQSEDHGKSWRSISAGLPASSLNALAQHHRTPNLWFVGNEIGVYFTTDHGSSWHRLAANLPTVPVDDIKIHPRENDLVLGTHGRGIWILPDIGPLEELSATVLASSTHLFGVRDAVTYSTYTPQGWTPGVYAAENPAKGALIRYHVSAGQAMTTEEGDEEHGENGDNGEHDAAADSPHADEVALEILDSTGQVIRTLEASQTTGTHTVVWDLRFEPPYEAAANTDGGGGFRGRVAGPTVLPGSYTVRLANSTQSFNVRLDPNVKITDADLAVRQEALMSGHALAKPLYESGRAVDRLERQLREARALVGHSDSAPEGLSADIKTLQDELEELSEKLSDVQRDARASGAVGGAYSRPTADQLYQLERAWEDAPGVIESVNAFLTDKMPALNARLDENGIRPSPGKAIQMPSRTGPPPADQDIR